MDNRSPDKTKQVACCGDPQAVGAYAQTSSYNPALTEQHWEASKKAWKDSPKGRGVIRAFSRGVMGTAVFALAGLYAGKTMKHYSPHKPFEELQGAEYIARFYDNVLGKPLKAAADFVKEGSGDKLVNDFRPSIFFSGYGGKKGRSLGHEVVMVTFDFAAMSIGDFWGRKIMHTLDPNGEPPKWKRKDGSIDWSEATKTFGKNWWTALTYSAGEDWAVAVPYVLTMRHVGTPLVNKMIPGYRFDFDLNGVGGGLKINEKGRITGNFTTAGVINLWERFTTYNVGTLLFREAYRWAGTRIKHWWKTGDMPDIVQPDPGHPNRSMADEAVDGAKQFTRWFARGVVKATLYMIPAVPFFWITRVPQHKFKGPFIHPEKGPLLYMKEMENGSRELAAVHATTLHNPAHPRTRFTDIKFTPHTEVFFGDALHQEKAGNPFKYGPIDPNAQTWGVVDTLLNPIAKATVTARETLRKPLGPVFDFLATFTNKIRKFLGRPVGKLSNEGGTEGRKRAGTYILASMAYTPYFWAKSDYLADKLDYGRMDVAVERMLGGAGHVNPGEFKAGIGEMWQAIKRQPLKDTKRELYAQCREATDESPSDNKLDIASYSNGSCEAILKTSIGAALPAKSMALQLPAVKHGLSWRERLVQGKPEEAMEMSANKRTSHAEKEELRKLLEQAVPPTNSIN
jgi:hypothetical protein